MSQVIIHHKGQSKPATLENYQTVMDELCAQLGPWDPANGSRIEVGRFQIAAPQYSEFGEGKQVIDTAARDRIAAQQAQLNAAGIAVDSSAQFYATGTRMAKVGYDTQAKRLAEHNEKAPLHLIAAKLTDTIKAEKRREIVLTGKQIASKLAMNGKLTVDGYRLSEIAIRGMLARAESNAASYVFGLRDRIVAPASDSPTARMNDAAADRAHLLATMVRELETAGDTAFMLRVRDGVEHPDVFTTVSPGYGIADAPLVVPDVVAALPSDAKGTMSYDPRTTTWQLRAHVFTPTPTIEQAVGEPFAGFGAFGGNDAGNGPLTGGGGLLFLICLNASIMQARSDSASRQHRGRILANLPAMIRAAAKAIETLAVVWGTAREQLICIELPKLDDGKLIPASEVIPGLFRNLLTDRRSELLGVLPGRRETHVAALAAHYDTQRRDPNRLVRADLAQAMTRYAHDLPPLPSAALERASAAWLASSHTPRFEAL